MRRFWILVPTLLALLVLTVTPASAQGGRSSFGQPVTVRAGETVDGDLVSFGGPVTVERGATVEGDVFSMGGPVTIGGSVKGNVMSFGGPVNLRGSAVIQGDIILMGGSLTRSEGVVVEGEVVEGFRFGDLRQFRFGIPPVSPISPAAPEVPVDVGNGSRFLSFIVSLLTNGLIAAGLAFIAFLLLVLVPEQTNMVKQMTMEQPIPSAGVGCLTLVVAAVVLPLLLISICGIPIMAILGIALLMAAVYGWIALGIMIGERLLTALNTERPIPLISGVLGVLLITLLALLVPCLGPLLGLIGISWGLGAVVLSRAGTQRYPSLPGGPARTPTPPAPPLPIPPTDVPPAEPETRPIAEEGPEAPPPKPAEAKMEELDDLKVIRGIGPVYERMLREAGGIRTYSDLAARTPEEVVEAVSGPSVIPTSVETARRWIEEAKRLAAEREA